MKIIIILLFFLISSCNNQRINYSENCDLFRQLVSDLDLLNSFTHLEIKRHYILSLEQKAAWSCADSLVWEIYNDLAPMFEKIVNSGGGLDPDDFFLMEDFNTTSASLVIKQNLFIEKVNNNKTKLRSNHCSINDKEKSLIEFCIKLLDALEHTLRDASDEKLALGEVYYHCLIFEGEFLFKGIQICQQE